MKRSMSGGAAPVPDRVAQTVAWISSHFSEDAILVPVVLLLDRAEHVVDRLAHVVPERHAVLQDVRHELTGAEPLSEHQTAADLEGGMQTQEQRIGVEQRHAGIATILGAERQVPGNHLPDQEELEMAVVDALREPGRPGGVDHHQVLVRIHGDVRGVEAGPGRSHFRGDAGHQVPPAEIRRLARPHDQDVLRRYAPEATGDAIDLRE
ncbi:MAG: hypothetical protein M5U32_14650 [Myxococcota bacterium]|nr:hypothetical protein [Myxococcota bacterium]